MTKLVRVQVRYYAQLRDGLGLSQEDVEVELPTTEPVILRFLANLHPIHADLILTSRLAVEDEYLPHGTRILELGSVDIISPVSGG